ncbi:SnoaL-like polyketide cyclase [Prauserella muralis]|nr:SnoaL-like polyketide cyclase [Prauserella muralis]
MQPFVSLMRRYVVDYTNRHDTTVCREIMEPDYVLHMGRFDLAGRDDAYIPAVRKQFEQFPGLTLTVHQLVASGDRLAMRFSEHGASVRHSGHRAAWAGIALYRWNGSKLTENFVEQDYFARRRQLGDGVCDPLEAPAPAPWDTTAEPANPAAERLVRDWLTAEWTDGVDARGVAYDDEWTGRDPAPLIAADTTDIHELFSAANTVAFRGVQHGTYLGGLGADVSNRLDCPANVHLAGLLTVTEGHRLSGRIVRDRLGLYRALRHAATGRVEPST